ncbi:MAG: DsbA family protein [Janthinobacterium lividum]
MKLIKYLIIILNFSIISLNAQDVFSVVQKDAINKAIDERIMQNPEILVASLKNFEETKNKEQLEKAKAYIQGHQDQIMNSPHDYAYGDLKGKVSMVIFMDPFCMHCRSFHKTLDDALKSSKTDLRDLRIVIKLISIFGDSSDVAVNTILAAKEQGKYVEFQGAMFEQDDSLTVNDVVKIAAKMKLDVARFTKDLNSDKVKSIVADNRRLAEDLGIKGTPTSIINDMLIPGEIDIDTLKNLISQSQPRKT